MPEIKAFRGWRYNPSTNPDLSKVLAPPYDVISPRQQKKLYEDNPYNVIRLELGRDEEGDSEARNKYTRAADYLRAWKKDLVLVHEDKPAIYVYVQDYIEEGKKKTRLGFLSLMKIDEKAVMKHENTLAAPKEDRLKLLRSTRTNISPIFGLFQDKKVAVNAALKKSMKIKPFVDVTLDGVRHRIFIETREGVIREIEKAMKAKPMFIADGHHRFETACNFKKEARAKTDQGSDFVLSYFADCYHNPFKIFPTHRLVKITDPKNWDKVGLRGFLEKVKDLDTLLYRLKDYREEVAGKPYEFGFYSKKYGFYLFKMSKKFALQVKNNPVDRLDVAVLHQFLIEPCFGIKKIEKSESIDFTRDPQDAMGRVDHGLFDAAIFLRPTSLAEMILASKKGLKMPQKSTYFYPKLLSGLVFHSFEDGIGKS